MRLDLATAAPEHHPMIMDVLEDGSQGTQEGDPDHEVVTSQRNGIACDGETVGAPAHVDIWGPAEVRHLIAVGDDDTNGRVVSEEGADHGRDVGVDEFVCGAGIHESVKLVPMNGYRDLHGVRCAHPI
jgi:hypothetical protein